MSVGEQPSWMNATYHTHRFSNASRAPINRLVTEMGAKLIIHLLGSMVVECNQCAISGIRSQKALALLAYLAHTAGTTHRREALADLLWDARTTKQSLSNLRTVLTQLRKEMASYLLVTRHTIAFDHQADYWLDTAALQNVLSAEIDSPEMQDGLQLYRGEFLEGLSFPDAPRFNEWAMLERERLHLQVIDRYRELATYHLDQADYKQGITISDGWLALDMLDEEAHRYRMRVLSLDGQRSRALAQYDQCVRILNEELGVEPTPATTALYEQIRRSTRHSVRPVTAHKVGFCPSSPIFEVGSYNGNVWLGVQMGAEKFGAQEVVRAEFPKGVTLEDYEASYTKGRTLEDYEAAYTNNLNELVKANCDLIISVSFQIAPIFAETAHAHPDLNFMLLDAIYDPPINNVWGQVYDTDEAAFLAGYVAAAVTKTGTVGTFGGFQFPPVETFMDGFARGVAYHNERKGSNVAVLGWDIAERTGHFINSFGPAEAGRAPAQQLIEQGADIILPAVSTAAFGAADIALEHDNVFIIGVDSDWGFYHPEYASVVLTSVEKRMHLSVLSALNSLNRGEFAGDTHTGTLKNGEVGLAPFRTFDALVSEAVGRELLQIKADIITGRVRTRPAST